MHLSARNIFLWNSIILMLLTSCNTEVDVELLSESKSDEGNLGKVSNDTTNTNSIEDDFHQLILDNQTVAYWRLGEGSGGVVKDENDENSNGAFHNVSLGEFGLISDSDDTAISYSNTGASDRRIEIPSNPSLESLNAFSMSMFIKPELFFITADRKEYIFMKGDENSLGSFGVSLNRKHGLEMHARVTDGIANQYYSFTEESNGVMHGFKLDNTASDTIGYVTVDLTGEVTYTAMVKPAPFTQQMVEVRITGTSSDSIYILPNSNLGNDNDLYRIDKDGTYVKYTGPFGYLDMEAVCEIDDRVISANYGRINGTLSNSGVMVWDKNAGGLPLTVIDYGSDQNLTVACHKDKAYVLRNTEGLFVYDKNLNELYTQPLISTLKTGSSEPFFGVGDSGVLVKPRDFNELRLYNPDDGSLIDTLTYSDFTWGKGIISDGPAFYIYSVDMFGYDMSLYRYDPTGLSGANFTITNPDGIQSVVPVNLEPEVPYHVVFQADSSVSELYLDGIFVGSSSGYTSTSSSDPLLIGNGLDSSVYHPFSGVIDEASFYEQLLTPLEINAQADYLLDTF